MSAAGGIEWGFRLVLWWGVFAVVGGVMLYLSALQRLKQSQMRRDMAKIKAMVCLRLALSLFWLYVRCSSLTARASAFVSLVSDASAAGRLEIGGGCK
jgi:hypothetical protein